MRKKSPRYQNEEEFSPKEKFVKKEKRYDINFIPANHNQELYWKALHSNTIIVAHGSAGTGKSLEATTYAMKEISKGNYDRLILCRANVPTGRTLGSFPGTVEEKLLPWLGNIIGYCKDIVGAKVVDCWLKGEFPKIILTPIETIRGKSFNDSIILVEEAQQLDFNELKTITTRIGRNSKLILTGDPAQRDTRTKALEEFVDLAHRYKISGFSAIKFFPEDIIRSDIVKELIIAFEKEFL